MIIKVFAADTPEANCCAIATAGRYLGKVLLCGTNPIELIKYKNVWKFGMISQKAIGCRRGGQTASACVQVVRAFHQPGGHCVCISAHKRCSLPALPIRGDVTILLLHALLNKEVRVVHGGSRLDGWLPQINL